MYTIGFLESDYFCATKILTSDALLEIFNAQRTTLTPMPTHITVSEQLSTCYRLMPNPMEIGRELRKFQWSIFFFVVFMDTFWQFCLQFYNLFQCFRRSSRIKFPLSYAFGTENLDLEKSFYS